MSLKNMFYEVSVDRCPKQQHLVDAVAEAAPLLAITPVEASTEITSHKYEEITSVEGGQSVDLDSPLAKIKYNSDVKTLDLGKIGGQMEVGKDKARAFGGPTNYFRTRVTRALQATAEEQENAMYSGNIRSYALANGKAIDAGAASDVYTIYAIRWTPGEITGMYSPNGAGDGKVFDVEPINGGNVYKDENGVLVYGVSVENYFGVMLANPRYVATIDNIDADNLPTEAQMDQLILNARLQVGGSSMLVMNPQVSTWLQKYKGSALQMVATDFDINRSIMMWNGIPILTSYNLSTNDAVAIS